VVRWSAVARRWAVRVVRWVMRRWAVMRRPVVWMLVHLPVVWWRWAVMLVLWLVVVVLRVLVLMLVLVGRWRRRRALPVVVAVVGRRHQSPAAEPWGWRALPVLRRWRALVHVWIVVSAAVRVVGWGLLARRGWRWWATAASNVGLHHALGGAALWDEFVCRWIHAGRSQTKHAMCFRLLSCFELVDNNQLPQNNSKQHCLHNPQRHRALFTTAFVGGGR
jgi:hypothetical protein